LQIFCIPHLSFNPRPRTGGDLKAEWILKQLLCFNPRPRTGGDPSFPELQPVPRVSIHAPARGATLSFAIHPRRFDSFNPRPRTGGDLKTYYRMMAS